MSSDPELKAAIVDLTLRYNRMRATVRRVYEIATMRGPINQAERLREITEYAGRALGRKL